MEINEDKVRRILGIIDAGLVHGGGRMRRLGDFCVQQVLTVIFSEIFESAELRPYGPSIMELVEEASIKGLTQGAIALTDGARVGRAVSALAMALNDQMNWGSSRDRAQGLRRLAIAEIGSEVVNQMQFLDDVATAFEKKYPDAGIGRGSDELLHTLGAQSMSQDMLRELANIAVDVLQRLGSPGCKFLYLCDDDKPIAEAAGPAESFVMPRRHLALSLLSRRIG